MKMEHQLRAERDGVIEALQCKQGEQVSQGAVLVRFVDTDADAAPEDNAINQQASNP
ncbi:MAG: acetyl-CoA carboxylase biotin carboxyl carrier protein subunit, partial [Aeromonas sobria]